MNRAHLILSIGAFATAAVILFPRYNVQRTVTYKYTQARSIGSIPYAGGNRTKSEQRTARGFLFTGPFGSFESSKLPGPDENYDFVIEYKAVLGESESSTVDLKQIAIEWAAVAIVTGSAILAFWKKDGKHG